MNDTVLMALIAILGSVVAWLLKKDSSQRREIRRLNAALLESAQHHGHLKPGTIDKLGEMTDPNSTED